MLFDPIARLVDCAPAEHLADAGRPRSPRTSTWPTTPRAEPEVDRADLLRRRARSGARGSLARPAATPPRPKPPPQTMPYPRDRRRAVAANSLAARGPSRAAEEAPHRSPPAALQPRRGCCRSSRPRYGEAELQRDHARRAARAVRRAARVPADRPASLRRAARATRAARPRPRLRGCRSCRRGARRPAMRASTGPMAAPSATRRRSGAQVDGGARCAGCSPPSRNPAARCPTEETEHAG